MEKERVKCVPVLGLALDVALVFITWLTVSAMRWSQQKGGVWLWVQHVRWWLPLWSCCTLMAVLVGAELPNGLCLLRSYDQSISVATPVFCPVQFCFHLTCGPVQCSVWSRLVSGLVIGPVLCLVLPCDWSSLISGPIMWFVQSCARPSLVLCPVLCPVQSCVQCSFVPGLVLCPVQCCLQTGLVSTPVFWSV